MIQNFIPEQYYTLFMQSYFGNTVEKYVFAIFLLVLFLVVFKIFQVIIVAKLKSLAQKTKTDIDDTLIKIINSVRPPFYAFLAFYLATKTLSFPNYINKVLIVILIIWIVYQVVYAVGVFIDYIVRKRLGGEVESGARGAISLLSLISKIVLWSFAFLFILQNLGVNITSLIAGLGIGGIAIAFALQKILGDLFSSFAIFFDKPFVIGDFIVVKDKAGTVEKIGIKTTRIKALQGEEIIFSNTELTSTVIQNFKKMQERRIPITIGVTYNTSSEKLKKIPELVVLVFKNIDGIRLDRVHFSKFNDSSLDIEIVYYVKSGEYNEYMDSNQKLLLGIKEIFEEEKIEFAYPTQTIYIEK